MSSGADVVWAGSWEPDALRDLEASGSLRVTRVPSALRATAHVQRQGAGVVLVAGDEVEGREESSFVALRAAGARCVAVLYRPPHAHRAPRAVALGADAALLLPAHPGEIEALVHGLLGRPAREGSPAPVPAVSADEEGQVETDAPDATSHDPEEEVAGTPDRRALESLIGDAALVHRAVSDLDRLLDRVLASFRTRSQATRCSLLLLDRARGELSLVRSENVPEDAGSQPIPLDSGLAGRVATSGRPLLVRDVAELETVGDARPSGRPEYRTTSCLILPLTASEGVAGVVCLADKRGARPFDDHDLRALLFLADQAGQALENALKLRQMQDMAVIDELTGLFNRRYFQGALKREVQRARRYDRSLTVAIMDLDKFKSFNDLCGHPAGDRALATVGDVLRTSLREVDIVARHGGEEFAVILPETSAAGANGTKKPFPFLERLRRRVEETPIEGEEKLPSGQLTISIGVACFPDDADTAEDLYQKADEALYDSKQHGRNVVTYRGRRVTE
jgi:diguanylate cyclase (GGDEF)-like protein